MRTVTCPDCKEEVYEALSTCPHCGYTLKEVEVHQINPSVWYDELKADDGARFLRGEPYIPPTPEER